ncbi:MAG: hypothetical protein U1E60_16195 [Reyranellaceae bacterium]
MAGSSVDRCCGRIHALKHVVTVAVCMSLVACASDSYQMAAMQASESGDQKTAIRLSKKEVARYSGADQCSRTTRLNCGTLALAYGTLAGYQILDGDSIAGEGSFRGAKEALRLTDPDTKASATAMVYRDVSEAFWKVGDRARAVAVFKEGRAAGADKWLYMSSAAGVADPPPSDQPSPGSRQPPSSK